ncbi:MAG: aldo/keto reductase family protein [Deltaproteobacteria bacterium]|nr:aldo/keto reductase family protein [Deltaproteobacteria bacterium]
MQTRRLGASGLQVSEIALGSWLTMGSAVDLASSAKLVERAFDLGVNFFDTADVYAGGGAEEVLGQALRTVPRPQVVLATKCFFPMSRHANDRGLSRKHLFESVEASLRRMGTDYLDLHQCHRADPSTPIEETVRAYEDLIRQGKLLYWGVSEWPAPAIAEACQIADARNAYRPVSNQPQYSIMRRQIEAEVLPVSIAHGIGQVVFSPLAQGALTGKYSQGARPAESRATDEGSNQWMGAYLEPEALARVDALRPLAKQLDISMAQLALAWCLRDPSVSAVITGATRLEQLEDNCRASGLHLPAEVLARIDEVFPGPGA